MKLRWLHIVLCLTLFTSLQAQDTLQVNRDAEDFVTASLMVAAPGDILYTFVGHACIRMQCPTFNLDYCFSYEGENHPNKIMRYLMGDLKMGMFAIPTQEYLKPYANDRRGVWEYEMNLPIAVKRELWRILDNRVMEGFIVPYDYKEKGCAISCIDCVRNALDTLPIYYAPWEEKFKSQTFREICYNNYPKGWNPFMCMTLIGSGIDGPLPPERKLATPHDLATVWQQATVCGQPLLKEGVQILPNTPRKMHLISPLIAALILLTLAIISLFLNKPYIDWLHLGLQTAIGLLITYLVIFSSLPGTEWNWLIIPFNPLPALLWHWRSKYSLPYAALLLCWCIGMLINPHQIVTTAHLLWVISFIIILIKQSTWWQTKRTSLHTSDVKHITK